MAVKTGLLIRVSDPMLVADDLGMANSEIYRAQQRRDESQLLTAGREELDLEGAAAVRVWFEVRKPEVVALAAAKGGGIYAKDSYVADFLLHYLKILNNLSKSARRNGTRRLLFLGSSCTYPHDCPQPIIV